MTGILGLWLPIVLSSVFVFIASSIIHMILPWHKNDYPKLPNEAQFMDAVRPLGLAPGDYMVPRPASSKDMKSPEFLEKLKKGPVMMFTVWRADSAGMGRSLALWFVYLIVMGVFTAYVTGRALRAGDPYLLVFRFAGVTAFLGYAVALWQMSIWYHRGWLLSFKATVDGLIYALLTAGTFGWLWPR